MPDNSAITLTDGTQIPYGDPLWDFLHALAKALGLTIGGLVGGGAGYAISLAGGSLVISFFGGAVVGGIVAAGVYLWVSDNWGLYAEPTSPHGQIQLNPHQNNVRISNISTQQKIIGTINGVQGRIYMLPPVNHQHATDPRVFSAEYYHGTFGDLRNAIGLDTAALTAHWLRHGVVEQRRSSSAFDVSYYLATHPDLRDAFGAGGSAAALSHWVNHGIMEGRRSSLIFDVQYYLNNNADLLTVFGPRNYAAALDHWLRHGLSEGRRASADFDAGFYLSANADLAVAFGANGWPAATAHYMEYGIAEGRKAIP